MDMGIKGLGFACSLSNLIIYSGSLFYPLLIPNLKPALILPSH